MYKVGVLMIANGKRFIEEIDCYTSHGASNAINNVVLWHKKHGDSLVKNVWMINCNPCKYHSEQFQI